jgi:arylsulfatase A-like enzyme
MPHVFRITTVLQLLLSALLPITLSSCSGPGGDVPPNVILIVMDTARAENFSCYGYHRPTSPNIDAFAREATFYTSAMASSPWTVPTHASIFTGKDPFEHGAHRLPPKKMTHILTNPLNEKHTTLAEAFAAEDFATGAFVANSTYINDRYQMDQGFQDFLPQLAVSDSINQWTYSWLDTLSRKPFFLFINYMDTHSPYNAKPRPGFLANPPPHDNGELQHKLKQRYLSVRRGGGEFNPVKLRQTVVDQYDTAIANLDEQIGYLLDYLKERDLYDHTLIVLTSDHGEVFGEHQLVSHGQDVYQQLLWVPLIIKAPGQTTPKTNDDIISSSDLPRMILSYLPDEMSKRHLAEFPNAPGLHPIIAENYYVHPWILRIRHLRKKYERIRTVLFEMPYKYIHSSDGQHELYNLVSDRKESNNLINSRLEIAEEMAARIQEYQDSRSRSNEVIEQEPLTEQELKQLKSLGYIGE